MASGKKNYFRHSFFARNDEFVCKLIEKFGLSGYFYYFALIEMCGESSGDNLQKSYKYHKRTLVHSLRLNTRKLNLFLGYLQDNFKITYTLTENEYEIIFPNISKYLGKYSTKIDTNSSNKKKRKEKKRKESKTETFQVSKPPNFEKEKLLIIFWNKFNIMRHNEYESNFLKVQKKLITRLKKNSIEEINIAIRNYNEALNIGWFNYKWPLWDFLGRENADKFYPGEYVKENYIKALDKNFKNSTVPTAEKKIYPDCIICGAEGIIYRDINDCQYSFRCHCDAGQDKYPSLPEYKN